MTSSDRNGSRKARLVWAVCTPPALVLAALFGFFLIPAVCLYLDGKSRTYTGAATVLVMAGAASLLLGPAFGGLFAFIAITTAAAYLLARIKQPFVIGLTGSALGGVVGAMALLGILAAGLGRPISEAWAEQLVSIANVPLGTKYDGLDYLAAWYKGLQLAAQTRQMSFELVSLPDAEKLKFLLPLLELEIGQKLPGLALSTGLLTGGLGYYLPMLALQAHRRRGGVVAGEPVEVPPFSTFKFPKYIVLSVFALQIIAMFGAENTGFMTMSVAASVLFNLLMTIQALAFLSFLLERKKLGPWLRLVILAPALLLFSWLLPYVGFFDALFDMRAVIARVDALKAKGKQVFTQEGLDELRKMDQSRKNGKNGKDGEDDEQ